MHVLPFLEAAHQTFEILPSLNLELHAADSLLLQNEFFCSFLNERHIYFSRFFVVMAEV